MLGLIQFSPKVGVEGRLVRQRFAYPRILEINKAGVGYAFQMWPSWPSLMGNIHTRDPHPATMHIHPFKAPPYSAYVHIKSSVSGTFKRIISAVGDYFGKPVVDGRVSPMWEGWGVQSANPDGGCFAATCTPTVLPHSHIASHALQCALPHTTPLVLHSAKLH